MHEKELILFEGQFGFRNNRSTRNSLIDVAERITDACDKGKFFGAFLDFKTTFRGQANNWFYSYLTQRVQVTSVNRFNSRPFLISHGVP